MTKIYLAGPMRGIRDFNFPAFMSGAAQLRALGHTVFNPAERDIERYGEGINISPTGSFADVPKFDQRKAMSEDLQWICEEADAVVTLEGWSRSLGARAEVATAICLGLELAALEEFINAD